MSVVELHARKTPRTQHTEEKESVTMTLKLEVALTHMTSRWVRSGNVVGDSKPLKLVLQFLQF